MKLKIKNFKKIVGKQLDGWVIGDVVESDTHYSFLCRPLNSSPSQYGQINNIRLKRDGIYEGEWKYRFWKPDNWPAYHQVTANWFSDIQNVAIAIEMELKKDFNK